MAVSSGKRLEKATSWLLTKNLIHKDMKITPIKNIQVVNMFKATALLMLFIISLPIFAQEKASTESNRLFTFEFTNTPVKQVFEYIQGHSNYIFLYYGGVIDNTRKVTVKVKEQDINGVLQQVLKGTSVSYEIKGRQIVLKKLKDDNPQASQQKQKTISGIVSDETTAEPIIGVTVMIKGKGTGTTTNIDGNFTLQCAKGDTLLFSYIGYQDEAITVKNSNIYAITMKEASEMLEEVVVTAFGTGQKKESVVGSIQTVRPNDLKVPSSNLSTSFAGRLAGVIAYQTSGQPGSNGANFYIRGISTLSGITSPLIVMDGVEISSDELNAIDPEIIESFSILKDATATAMYGTRGANGVMIIKTKSGRDQDKPTIGFRIEANVTQPVREARFVDGPTYMNMFNEAIHNQNTADTPFTSEEIEMTRSGAYPYLYPNVDWYDEVFKGAAFNQKVNFNVRGGTNRITYFMNAALNHETGMLRNRSNEFYSFNNNINLYRFTFQNNIDFHLSKSSTISLHLNVRLTDDHGPATNTGDIYNSFLSNNPVDFPVYFPNNAIHGETSWVKWGAFTGGNVGGATNPVEQLTNGYSDSFASTINANIDFEQKLDMITKGLRFKALFSFKNWTQSVTTRQQSGWNLYYVDSVTPTENGGYEYTIAPWGEPTNPVLNSSFSSNGDRRIYFQTFIDYNRTFADVHNVSGMFLFNMDNYSTNVNSLLLTSLPKHKIGYAFRASYAYDDRYMIEFNAGYNGSENFAEGHRYGFFPAVAIGWNVSREKFWEPIQDVISNLKLRASYGLVGNDQIGSERFIYLSDVNLQGTSGFRTGWGNYTQSLSGPTYARFQNNDITWEVGKKLNVGIDLQLWHSLNLTVDVFKERRENIFQARNSIPDYWGIGGTTIYGNFATVDNKGVDFSIDYGQQITRDFAMQFKGTFTFARNKVVKYDEPINTRYAKSRIGHSVNQNFGYVADGLYRDEEDIKNSPTSTLGNIGIAPGDIKYVDQPDNDGVYDNQITSDDQIALGHPSVPEIVYGFGPSMQYKNWDFSFFFQGQANVSFMINAGSFAPFGTQYHRNVMQFIADDYWSEANPNTHAAYPRLTVDANSHNNQSSSYWLRNGAFLKLKNIEIGYSFNKKCRLYVSGENMLTFSPFKEWDPEMGANGAVTYPNQRIFNIGFQMSFN